MNELLRFKGTTEGSFMSVMRRSLVIVHKASFFSAPDLAASFPAGGHWETRVFPRGRLAQGVRDIS